MKKGLRKIQILEFILEDRVVTWKVEASITNVSQHKKSYMIRFKLVKKKKLYPQINIFCLKNSYKSISLKDYRHYRKKFKGYAEDNMLKKKQIAS